MPSLLPDDVMHLICIQLWHQKDFNTLFNCAMAAKQLALPALANMYRMHDVAPVTNGGTDEVDSEVSRQDSSVNLVQQQDQIIAQWANLWRSLILSALGKAAFSYCRYIRALNLGDLNELLQDVKFKGSISRAFFKGDLSKFYIEMESPVESRSKIQRPRRLNRAAILDAVGEVMTERTPMLEELSGELSWSALLRWVPRLSRLQHMTLWNGSALSEGVGNLIRDHCHFFRTLKFYEWPGAQADQQMAQFLKDLRPQSLESLEIISYSDIAAETFMALNSHCDSLRELRLNNIKPTSMPALSLMGGCKALTSLLLSEATATTDLENTQNDVFLETIKWLRNCRGLRNITLQKMLSASAIVTPVLQENAIHLVKLEVEGYSPHQAQDFHKALAMQDSLRSLWLKGEGEDFIGSDIDVLVDSLCTLGSLKDLRLKDVSDYFRDEHICRLARNLCELEEWWTSGYGITDAIWPDVAMLTSLRRLEINALASFTADGMLEYIARLGPGNNRMILSVMMADPESSLTEEEQALVREVLASRLEGRFDYILASDPNAPDYDESGSD